MKYLAMRIKVNFAGLAKTDSIFFRKRLLALLLARLVTILLKRTTKPKAQGVFSASWLQLLWREADQERFAGQHEHQGEERERCIASQSKQVSGALPAVHAFDAEAARRLHSA